MVFSVWCKCSTVALDWGFLIVAETGYILFLISIWLNSDPKNTLPLSWTHTHRDINFGNIFETMAPLHNFKNAGKEIARSFEKDIKFKKSLTHLTRPSFFWNDESRKGLLTSLYLLWHSILIDEMLKLFLEDSSMHLSHWIWLAKYRLNCWVLAFKTELRFVVST